MKEKLCRALALSLAITSIFSARVLAQCANTVTISSSVAYATLTTTGSTTSTLFTVNLTTGALSTVGSTGGRIVGGIAVRDDGMIFATSASGTMLLSFAAKTPATILTEVTITGLQPAETILGIDFRPSNGSLYGLGSTSRLYVINTTTAVATQVGSGQFTTLLSGTAFGFDANPVADRIRIVSNTGQNLRVDPATGVVTVDAALNPGSPRIVGAAYTNSFSPLSSSTTLYDIDSTADTLNIQNPPNNGTLTLVGALGVDTSDFVGFDISNPHALPNGVTNTPYSATLTASGGTAPYTFTIASGALPPGMSLSTSGVISGTTNSIGSFTFTIQATDSAVNCGTQSYTLTVACPAIKIFSQRAFASLTVAGEGTSALYSINLTSGAATLLGPMSTVVRGLAISSDGFGFVLSQDGTALRKFSTNDPSTILSSLTITGLPPGQTILAIDFRPLDGLLYGITSSALFVIDTNTGVATQIGAGGIGLSGTSFGFDVNPVVDRIRVVSNLGQNLRLNPATGAIAAIDTALNGGATAAVGSAYTNNYAGATVTTLYDIDAATDSLYIQNPPNNGTLVLVGALGVNTSDVVGFDIGMMTGLPDGTVSVPYSQVLTVVGSASFTTFVSAGALPPGLSLASDGLLSGTPNTGGDFSFTITAADATSVCGGSQAYVMHIRQPVAIPINLVAAATNPTRCASRGSASL